MRPLSGVRVLDAATYVSGPFAAMALADLGAEVVKVETPRGDPFRRFGLRRNGLSLQFAACNANKRSVALDLKDPRDAERFRAELERGDVLITNWRPRVALRLGLDAAAVRDRYPRLVWARISGFGQTGPSVDRPAFDAVLQARSGAIDTAVPDPKLMPGYVADKVAGLFTAQAVLAALLQRSSKGTGAVVDVAMLDSLAYFHGPDLTAGDLVMDLPERKVARHVRAVRPIATKDGWFVVSPVTRSQLSAALAAVDHPEWSESFRDVVDAVEMISKLYSLLDEVLPNRTSAEWEQSFADADVPASAVLNVMEHFDDPQTLHNGTYHEFADPIFGRIRRVRHPALFDGEPAEVDDLPVPMLPD